MQNTENLFHADFIVKLIECNISITIVSTNPWAVACGKTIL